MLVRGFSRRGQATLAVVVLLLAGAGAATAAAGGGSSTAGAWSFRSEPGLSPMQVKVDVSRAGKAPGLLFVAPFSSGLGPLVGQAGPLILDARGNPVWFRALPAGQQAADFREQTLYGKPVLVWWQGTIAVPPKLVNLPAGTPEPGAKFIVLDQHYRQIAAISARNGWTADLHELLMTPRGTALFEVAKTVPADLSAYGGPASGQIEDSGIQEIDGKTGRLVYQWDMLKHVSPAESQVKVPAKGIWDPFHMNSIDPSRSGHLLISARNTAAIYDISRATGRVNWQLGGKNETIKPTAAATFSWQHDARYLSDGEISLFDDACCNQPGGLPAHYARGLVLKLDLVHHRATVAKQYGHQPPLYVASQGNTQVLPGGGALVGWGQLPYLTEYARGGRIVLDMKMPGGDESYRALLSRWTATPYYAPRVELGGAKGRPVIYASWNGATQVAAWEVFGGRTTGRVKVLVPARRRTGFETAIALGATRDTHFVIWALDARGRPLASTRAALPGGA